MLTHSAEDAVSVAVTAQAAAEAARMRGARGDPALTAAVSDAGRAVTAARAALKLRRAEQRQGVLAARRQRVSQHSAVARVLHAERSPAHLAEAAAAAAADAAAAAAQQHEPTVAAALAAFLLATRTALKMSPSDAGR